ncbi:hypothetical protein DFJ58DRAFT_831354 [Suillus subalutaceus]|uniref:uncharacterized protein n=1 Tax=Suillus subalutaceus TaxID=48586 RepID=UPI001B8688E6|nr:uncharacterized protein DFJ58DRAFT_831354 [Suillus subalutaceus]KAG1822327.1 hypothetical protein DFJ58DRAFT_831354 [Suillus subalutaceus]
MQTDNSNVNLSTVSDIIVALQTILCSRATIPDLETPYSRTTFPNPNHCAIELKDQSISAIITERQHQLEALSHDISGLQTVMDGIHTLQQQLFEQKNKIIESINLHKRLVSPLWRLPTEVLSQIFCHCLPQIPELDQLRRPSKLTAPMLLTKICRRWREIAVGMPNLWCVLCVESDDRNWQQATFFYDTWLKRARGRPLSLRLHFYSDVHSTKLRHLIQPYVNQISSLSVGCYYASSDTPEHNIFSNLLALQEMSVYIYTYIPGDNMPAIFRVGGWSFDSDEVSSCNPVWAHLTSLSIRVREAKAALHLLQLAPNLSLLMIRITFDDVQALGPFTHTNLQTLGIYCDYPDESGSQFCDLLDALSLPTLRVLYVYGVPEWPHEEFKAFLARSECPLESLIVHSGEETDEQQAEYLALIPSSLQFVSY